VDPAAPVKVKVVLESCKTGFAVTTKVTGRDAAAWPEIEITAAVLYTPG
jgi:hypothetical protein